MPSIAYGSSAYRRTNGNFPELKLENMFVERSATSENQIALLSRAGLVEAFSNGSGPIYGLYAQEGTFGGDLFSVSNTTVFRQTANIGNVSGTGTVSWAGGYGELLVTRGETLHSYNGTNFTDSGFVGNSSNRVTATCFINSSFIAIEYGSARYYWSDPLNGRAWNGTHFATAERAPDILLDVAPLQNNLWLFGEASVEVHRDTGDQDARFEPVETLGYNKGIFGTGSVCAADNALFFVGSDKIVYRIGEAPQRVSDNAIEEAIGGSSTALAFSFKREGHEFVCIRLDSETWEYDCATQAWNQASWPVSSAAMVGNEAHFGHVESGKVMVAGGWLDLDAALERRFTAAMQLEGPLSVDRLSLWANTGHTEVLEGQGSDPLIEMRFSRDAGNTWSDWKAASLGREGNYRVTAVWRRLGMFDAPGAMFDFRCSDPVPLRISSVKVNDTGGGRGR